MKRRPENDLNHDNWNDEEEPDAVGNFEKASENEMKTRIIKTAKRRVRTDDTVDGEPAKTNIFAGFTGFSKTASTVPTAAPLFSFTKKSDEPAATKAIPTFGTNYNVKPDAIASQTINPEKYTDFCSKLKDLNTSFLKSLQSYVDSGKPCIFTPLLDDYKKFLKEIESSSAKTDSPVAASLPATTAPASPSATSSETNSQAQPKPFSFGSLGGSSFSYKPASLFGGTAPSLPAPAPAAKNDGGENKEDDDEDSPPKVEFTPVVETDSLFNIRCKVFVKKDSEYASRGAGTLFLKSVANDKVQLLVRADTNLGNILINFLLSAAIPAKRLGKNNVMMVCIPTPESEPKTVPILLRVKDEAEADKLLAEITKHSKWVDLLAEHFDLRGIWKLDGASSVFNII